MKKGIMLAMGLLILGDGLFFAQDQADILKNQWNHFFDAWVKGDAMTCAGFFCEDGVHLRPGGYVDDGRAAIAETFKGMLSMANVEFCRQKTLNILPLAHLLLETGTYEQKWQKAEQIMSGCYLAVWKKEPDGQFRLLKLIFN